MRKIVATLILILATFIISRYVFEPTNLYYEFPWLDIPMHILGGFLVVNLFASLFAYQQKRFSLSWCLLTLFVVMIIWEVYEYGRGVVLYDDMMDYFDSIKDIIFGFLGGFLAYRKNK